MPDTNWHEVVKTVSSAASVPLLAWFLGRKAAQSKEKLDLRSADQKSIEHLAGRVDKLEERVEKLTGEKMTLQLQIIDLQKQVAQMEIEKREYVSRDAMTMAQVHALEQRLIAKEEELHCAEARLVALENKL